jgi:MFS family permease
MSEHAPQHVTVQSFLGIDPSHRRVVIAASLGTVFEWYDFYLYGALASTISRQFFSAVNESTGFILALLAFAAGFAVRPLGAILFGRLGDVAGRKHTFLMTVTLMGLSTMLVGLLPTYASIGVAAPFLLVGLRVLQGLALGGEYGGAAVYVAEYAPADRRGRYTGWIKATATIGLLLSLVVVLGCRFVFGQRFETWGWRVPFLLSLVLLLISVYVRLRLEESPVFRDMRDQGTCSAAPLTEALLRWDNLRVILASLFGLCAGSAVIWYSAQVYALFFLTQVLKLPAQSAALLMAGVLTLAAPLFALSGALSDRLGRKPLVLAGCLFAAVALMPIFHGLTHYANPALESAIERSPVTVVADARTCALQFDPLGKSRFDSSCDIAKAALTKRGIPYVNEPARPGALARIRVGAAELDAFEGAELTQATLNARRAQFDASLDNALKAAGYPLQVDPQRVRYGPLFALLLLLLVAASLACGSQGAWLTELFPPRIRYTSLSVPFHFAVGWFGGFLPAIAFAVVAASGDMYRGLWYPIGFCLLTFVVGGLFLPETHGRPDVMRSEWGVPKSFPSSAR